VRRLATALLLPVLAGSLLAGCGSASKPRAAATDTATDTASAGGLPTVSGDYGSKPTFTFPSKTPPSTLMSKVLKEGSGPATTKGDLLVADYLGTIWDGKTFDNSYDRKAPSGFPIGVGKVVAGWDKVLVGVKAGSRVLMSLPPADGYGAQGNAQAGIKGTDTLVFVVDIVASYKPTAGADPAAVDQKASTPGITVAGKLGSAPTLAVKKGTKAPTAPVAVVLFKGTGAPIVGGQLVAQFVATSFDGTPAGSTWTNGGPMAEPVSPSGTTTPFDTLRGVPLGSRVLLEIPAGKSSPAVAVIVDLIGQPKTAAETP
jgi:peptidylprolyl isomerase